MAIASRQQCLRHRRRAMADINVVPYIDVMLVLLVIFMVTAPLLSEGVKVKLPQANTRPMTVVHRAPLVVSVNARGAYYVNVGEPRHRPVDPQTLVARVAAVLRQRPDTSVLVRGDRDVRYEYVIDAMVLLQKAGVKNVGLITQPPPSRQKR